MTDRPATPVALAVGAIPWEGNITPLEWFKPLRREPDKRELRRGRLGKPHTNAIIVRSDLVYWYRRARSSDQSRCRLPPQVPGRDLPAKL